MMVTVKGKAIEPGSIDFNMPVVEELIYFDGPLVTSRQSVDGKHYIELWMDCEPTHNTWGFIETTEQILNDYKDGIISLRALIMLCPTGQIYIVDQSGPDYGEALLVNVMDIPEDYMPTPDAYFQF